MIIHDVTAIHLMLCTFLPSNLKHDDAEHVGWYYSMSSLRDEWRRRYCDLMNSTVSQSTSRTDCYYNFERAASDDSYFVTDFADVGSETDVWNNCERVLVRVFMLFIDLNARLTSQSSSRSQNRRADADKQREALSIVRKYTPANVKAACLIRCQRWDEAVQVLDLAGMSPDACMLAVMNDVWGLSPRYEHRDGLSVGVGGYVIKAFLSPSFPLLPACYLNWQSSQFCPHASIYVFVTMALCLDAGIMNRLQASFVREAGDESKGGGMDGEHESGGTLLALFSDADAGLRAGSCLTQQLIGWLLLHAFDDPENPRATKACRKHVMNDILAPILKQAGVDEKYPYGFNDQFNFEYVNEIWKHCAGYLELIARQAPMHLIEAGNAHFCSVQFDKWADCIMNALVFCIPDPSMCDPDSTPFLVASAFFTQERRAVLQEVTAHLTELLSCPLDAPDWEDKVGDVGFHHLYMQPNQDAANNYQYAAKTFVIAKEAAEEAASNAAADDDAESAAAVQAYNAAVAAAGGADPFFFSKKLFDNKIRNYTQTPGSGSWLQSSAGAAHEHANPKLQYILQMLAVARAFQAHADGFNAGSVLDIITGRPELFDAEHIQPDGTSTVLFNSARSSQIAGSDWPGILMPVVAGTCDNVSYFFVQQPRDVDADAYGNVLHSPFPSGLGRFVFDTFGNVLHSPFPSGLDRFEADAFEPDLSWLLPPYDEEQNGELLRVPLHPAVCLHGTRAAALHAAPCELSSRCQHAQLQ